MVRDLLLRHFDLRLEGRSILRLLLCRHRLLVEGGVSNHERATMRLPTVAWSYGACTSRSSMVCILTVILGKSR